MAPRAEQHSRRRNHNTDTPDMVNHNAPQAMALYDTQTIVRTQA